MDPNVQTELAKELVEDLMANYWPDPITYVELLDALAMNGMALVKPESQNVASEAYLQTLSK